jgi:hypothetical protein
MRTCALFLAAGALALLADVQPLSAQAAESAPETPGPAVGAQYDGAHVYLAPADLNAFAKSFVATFGGEAAAPAPTTVTPTPSGAMFAPLRTPAGPLSVLAFTTPVPYPFGSERVGYLVKDLDAAVAAAVAAGAGVVVAPFADPIGRDAIVEWPGGAIMQLYWHNVPSSLPPLATVPEQRVYVPREQAEAFVTSFLQFSKGVIVSDEPAAPGVEIGRPGETFRRVRIASDFGRLAAFVTDAISRFRSDGRPSATKSAIWRRRSRRRRRRARQCSSRPTNRPTAKRRSCSFPAATLPRSTWTGDPRTSVRALPRGIERL